MHNHLAHPELPPGPRGSHLYHLYRWMKNTRGFLEETHREFGDVFTIRTFAARPIVCFSDPAVAREMMRETGKKLGHGNEVVQATLGTDNVLLKNGEPHLHARRRLMPAFTGAPLFALGPTMKEAAEEAIDGLATGPEVRMTSWARRVTLSVMQRSLFGMTDGPGYRAMADDVLQLAEEGQKPLSFMLAQVAPASMLERIIRGRIRPDGTRIPDPVYLRPALGNPLIRANRRMVDRILEHVRGVREGRIEVPENSMLANLLRISEAQGEPLTNLELANDLITLLVAGHDTTAVSFSTLLQTLAHHPEVVTGLRRELAENGGLSAMSAETVGRLPYLDAVVRESMRLTPIAPGMPRTTLEPITLGGLELPAGVTVLALTFTVHRDERVWDDAMRFDPGRMMNDRVKPETWYPFGGGYRRCVGAYLATLELKILLAAFVERVSFEAAAGADPLGYGDTGILTGPRDEGPMRIISVEPRGSVIPTRPAQPSSSLAL